MMKKIYFTVVSVGVLLLQAYPGVTQEIGKLELEEAYALAEENYPLLKNSALIESIYERNIDLLKQERRPQVNLLANGQYQSENVSIGADNPESPISVDAPNETFRIYGEVNLDLYDGGLNKAKRKIEAASLAVNDQSLKVQLRNLKDRVNQLIFAIKLSRQQHDLIKISIQDIETSIDVRQVGYENGTVLESEVSKLKVRKLELESEALKLQADSKAYLDVLNHLIGKRLTDSVEFVLPNLANISSHIEVNRPELTLYDFQQELLSAQGGTIAASRKPTISLYAQNGIGYPNPLNFSDISTSWYALAGVNFRWRIFDWGKSKNQYQELELQSLKTQNEREAFEFDIQSKDDEYRIKIEALQSQIINDQRIVSYQNDITEQIKFQLQQGVINTNDYLTQVNAELSARQELELHRVQLQQLQVEYLTHFGKL